MSRHRRRDCPLCGGHQTVDVSRGSKVEWLAQCFKCHARFEVLAPALGLPLENKKDRHHRQPPSRGTAIDIAIQELAVELEDRRARMLPWADYLEMSAEVRWEMNEAKLLRKLATDLGPPSGMGWDFLEEAAQREQRARLLILELDRQLDEQNQTRQQFLAGIEVTT